EDPEDYAQAFTSALESNWRRDLARGTTSVGPHRGDLLASLDGREARSFGSQGQQRSCVLALKLSEVRSLAGRLESPPSILFVEVSSELDRDRTRMLFEAISALKTQVWVSTTGAAPLPLPEDVQLLAVSTGKVTAGAVTS
ncbi:MAG: DNA replication and repair protein RecF, partial [Myxococcota bacterium]